MGMPSPVVTGLRLSETPRGLWEGSGRCRRQECAVPAASPGQREAIGSRCAAWVLLVGPLPGPSPLARHLGFVHPSCAVGKRLGKHRSSLLFCPCRQSRAGAQHLWMATVQPTLPWKALQVHQHTGRQLPLPTPGPDTGHPVSHLHWPTFPIRVPPLLLCPHSSWHPPITCGLACLPLACPP